MESKVSEWRPGPTVCRCCLSEGCYKDISTEYFWMGKREVYAEMLSETLDLSISYSASGGPNSNSRLICENCIARLRDATDFKRQVQECEKTFIQHIDGGANITDAEVQVESAYSKPVKVEDVKLEKRGSDDDFDDRGDFLGADDDDDDLDDQPLTKIASRTPKKETVDILDLLDNAKAAEKRKSTTKTKTPPAKKLKKKEPLPKPSASKTLSSDKKKKGFNEKAKTQERIKRAESTSKIKWTTGRHMSKVHQQKQNIRTILQCSNAMPFRYHRGKFLCALCPLVFTDDSQIRIHEHKTKIALLEDLRYDNCLKIDVSDLRCEICYEGMPDFEHFKKHLTEEHSKQLHNECGDGVVPFSLKDGYNCVVCGENFQFFMSLNKHMNSHYMRHVCKLCGKGFLDQCRLRAHVMSHKMGKFPCPKCEIVLDTLNHRNVHIAKAHAIKNRHTCPHCDVKFSTYNARNNHLRQVHGKVIEHRCPLCPAVFAKSGSRSQHLRVVHAGIKRHACSLCPSRFGTPAELKNHMIKHNGKREFECEVCKKAYARKKTLTEHMRIHNNDRRFVCCLCSQSFIQNCSLKHHIKVHHPEAFQAL